MDIIPKLGVIGAFAILIQFMYWVLIHLNIETTVGSTLTLLLSAMFSLSVIFVLVLNQQQKDIKTLKSEIRHKEISTMPVKEIINKRGMFRVDAGVLWILIAIILLYLLYKSFIA